MNNNAIIGKVVQFTTNKDAFNYGVVLGTENIVHNDKRSVVTGYLIQDTKNGLHHVAYWRLTRVMQDEESIQPSSMNTKDLFEAMGLEKQSVRNMFFEEEDDDLPF